MRATPVDPTTARARWRRLDGVLAVAVLAIGSLAIGATATTRTAAPTAAALLAVADKPPAEIDRLPAGFPAELHGTGGLLPSSSRYLGTVEKTSAYWVVRDGNGDICLVLDDRVRGMTGAACGSAADLADGAISLSVSRGTTGGYQAFLVGDGFASKAVPAPWIRAGGNLIAIPLDEADGSRLELRRGEDLLQLVAFPTG